MAKLSLAYLWVGLVPELPAHVLSVIFYMGKFKKKKTHSQETRLTISAEFFVLTKNG